MGFILPWNVPWKPIYRHPDRVARGCLFWFQGEINLVLPEFFNVQGVRSILRSQVSFSRIPSTETGSLISCENVSLEPESLYSTHLLTSHARLFILSSANFMT